MKGYTYFFLLLICSACLGITANAQTERHILPKSFYETPYDFYRDFGNQRGPYSHNKSFSLDVRDSCMVLTFQVNIDSANQEIWVGGDETFILDMRSGTKYAAIEAMRGAKLNAYNVVDSVRRGWQWFQIRFPRLRRYETRDSQREETLVKIYGVPAAGLNGEQHYSLSELQPVQHFKWELYPEHDFSPLLAYEDAKPMLKQPRLVSKPIHYNPDDTTTFPVYTDLPKVYPLTALEMEHNSVALWCTPEVTYVTSIYEIKHFRTVFYIRDKHFVIGFPKDDDDDDDDDDMTLPNIMPLSTEPYPIDRNFIVEATPGDFVVFTFEYPPVPIGTNDVDVDFFYSTYSHTPPQSDDTQFNFGKRRTVGNWRANQRFVRPLISTEVIIK